MLRAFGHRVAMCCDMLGDVGSNLKMVKLEPTHPTCRNMVAKRTQHVAPNNVATCCVGMLRSFGRGFSLRVPADKIALPEGGTVLFETRSIDAVRGTTKWKLWRGKFITITLKLNLPH